MMFNKKNIFVFVIALTVLMGILFVNSSELYPPRVDSPVHGQNYSGTMVLNGTFVVIAGTNESIHNVTFAFSNGTGEFALNSTLFNTSVNQSFFQNSTFNTSLLADGNYSVVVFAYNRSGQNSTQANLHTINITVDNNAPSVVAAQTTAATNFYSNASVTNTTFNATVTDFSFNSIKNVTFYFDNATGTGFNLTANNNSGVWITSLNASYFHAGTHTITIFAIDYTNHTNSSETINFTVNTGMNITLLSPLNGSVSTTLGNIKNFSLTSSNQSFNLTVLNVTYPRGTASLSYQTQIVYFTFNNGSGTDFNVSAVQQNWQNWSFSYNVSTLAEGAHVVSIFANDTINNVNNTESFNFTVDFTGPAVTSLTPADGSDYTLFSSNQTFGINTSDALVTVRNVTAMISNDNGVIGNSTATNYSGLWNLSYNVSTLKGGTTYTIRWYSLDVAGNYNSSETSTFTVNTPLNVSAINSPAEMRNFTVTSSNQTFNVTVHNGTKTNAVLYVTNITFQFDNGNGTPFNRTGYNLTKTEWGMSHNVSTLTDGQYIVTIFANDSNGNTNNTQTVNFSVDNTAPGITVTCTPSSVTKGAAVACSCGATDAVSGVKGAVSFLDTTPSTSTVGSGTTEACSAVDQAGNTNTVYGSFTVTAASSGGSGSSGSSGGISSGSAGTSSKKVWASINAGETATVPVANGAIGITEVSFKVSETVYGGWAQVLKHDSLPSSVKSFAGKTYRNLEITTGNALNAEAVTDRVIKFKVENDWLKNNALTSTKIALYHYTGGEWVELSTTKGEDDGTYVHYTATTPGFSYFVIGEKVGAPTVEAAKETAEPTSEGTSAPTDSTTETPEESGSPVWVWIALAVILIAAGVWYWMRRN